MAAMFNMVSNFNLSTHIFLYMFWVLFKVKFLNFTYMGAETAHNLEDQDILRLLCGVFSYHKLIYDTTQN